VFDLGSRRANPFNQNKQPYHKSQCLLHDKPFEKLKMLLKSVTKTETLEPIQRIITKKQVTKDFENLINPYCEQYHVVTGITRPQICKIMIKKFGKKVKHGDDWIRKRIEQKYKSLHRIKNAQQRSKASRIKKIPEKINKLEGQLAELTKTTVDFVKSG